MWNSDAAHTVTELPVLPGHNYGSASQINIKGQVIGFSAYATPGTWDVTDSKAVIWVDGGVFDLQSLLDPATGAGWTIENAAGMNDCRPDRGHGLQRHPGRVRIDAGRAQASRVEAVSRMRQPRRFSVPRQCLREQALERLRAAPRARAPPRRRRASASRSSSAAAATEPPGT